MSRILAIGAAAVLLAMAIVPNAPAQTTDPHDPTSNWIRLTVMNLPGPNGIIPDQDPSYQVDSSGMTCWQMDVRGDSEVTFQATCRAPPGDGCREMVQYATTTVGLTSMRQGCTKIEFLWWEEVDFYQGCDFGPVGVERRCGVVFHPNSPTVQNYVCEVTTRLATHTVSTHCEFGEGLSPA